ncbi:MAG: hotdog fold thioesterase [Desulfarculaceae bacterium]|jgi:acyl-CoA thioesterase
MSQDPISLLWKRSQKEPFRRLLDMEVLEIKEGQARVAMDFRPEMTNIFGMLHGGAVFSLLDEAFQLACNAWGTVAVALQINIYYLAPAQPGQRIIAEVSEINATRKTALYDAVVKQEDGKVISRAQTMAYRTGRDFPFDQNGELKESE